MKFIISNNQEHVRNLMRRLSYHPHKNGQSFARRLTANEFPRFHIYFQDKAEGLELSLHLDQKGACYKNQTAHSGDYDNQILEDEKNRILNELKS